MIYSKLRISSRLALASLCIAFLHLNSAAQQTTAGFELAKKPTGVGVSNTPAKLKAKALFSRKSLTNSPEMTGNQQTTMVRPSKAINSITAAGDTLFFQDFQDPTWPADMPRVNVDGFTVAANLTALGIGANAWINGTQSAGTGNRAALSTSWYTPAGQSDDWMMTPPISVTAGNILSWRARAIDADFRDGYEVRVCTNCPSTFTAANVEAAFTTTLFSVAEEEVGNNVTFPFVDHEIDLAAYAGQTVQFAFRNNSDDKFLLLIDDILVSKKQAVDASITAVLSPNAGTYLCGSTSQPFFYSIKNKGLDTLKNVPVSLELSGAATATLTMTVPEVLPGATDTIMFTGTANVSLEGTYNVAIYSTYPNDAAISNDTATGTFDVGAAQTYPISLDFEDVVEGSIPDGWWSDQFAALAEHGTEASLSLTANCFAGVAGFPDVLEANLITPKIEEVDPNGFLTLKYRLVEFSVAAPTTDYVMDPGDSIIFYGSKNCGEFVRLREITSNNHESSLEFAKLNIPLTPLGIASGDVISLRIQIKHNGVIGDFMMDIDDFGVKMVTPYDLKMVTAKLPLLSKVKLKHVNPITLGATVSNEGIENFGQWRVVANVTPGNFADSSGLNSLAAGVAQQLSFTNTFTPTQTGLYNINYTAKALSATQVEVDLDNNSISTEFEVTDSTMARDIGETTPDIPGGLGLGALPGRRIIGQTYRTKVADTLTSISFWVDDIQEAVLVKGYFCRTNNTTGVPTPVTGQDSTLAEITVDPAEAFNWHTVDFKKPTFPKGRPLLANTRYLFGIINTEGDLRVGINSINYEPATTFIWFNGAFTSADGLTFGGVNLGGNVFIRPNFGRLITTAKQSQIEMSLDNAGLYPNPATGSAKLALNLSKPSYVIVSISSLTGKEVSSTTFDAQQGRNAISLPTEGLAKGVYMVKINAQGFASTKKLIID